MTEKRFPFGNRVGAIVVVLTILTMVMISPAAAKIHTYVPEEIATISGNDGARWNPVNSVNEAFMGGLLSLSMDLSRLSITPISGSGTEPEQVTSFVYPVEDISFDHWYYPRFPWPGASTMTMTTNSIIEIPISQRFDSLAINECWHTAVNDNNDNTVKYVLFDGGEIPIKVRNPVKILISAIYSEWRHLDDGPTVIPVEYLIGKYPDQLESRRHLVIEMDDGMEEAILILTYPESMLCQLVNEYSGMAHDAFFIAKRNENSKLIWVGNGDVPYGAPYSEGYLVVYVPNDALVSTSNEIPEDMQILYFDDLMGWSDSWDHGYKVVIIEWDSGSVALVVPKQRYQWDYMDEGLWWWFPAQIHLDVMKIDFETEW